MLENYERDMLSYLTIDSLCDFSMCLLSYEWRRNIDTHKEASILRNTHLLVVCGREAVEARLESTDKEAIGGQL